MTTVPEQDHVEGGEIMTASAAEQTLRAEDFLRGLLLEFGASATVTAEEQGNGIVEVRIDGEGLGTLIGPKGATLLALQELTRIAAQHHGVPESRLVVDVNGYRRRRQEALTRFAQQVAAEVKTTNTRRALEPMPPADRKVVHDAVNAVDGVSTISQGEEPYRRVVLIPAGSEVGGAQSGTAETQAVSS
jgi:spoIIIJ-associated protein